MSKRAFVVLMMGASVLAACSSSDPSPQASAPPGSVAAANVKFCDEYKSVAMQVKQAIVAESSGQNDPTQVSTVKAKYADLANIAPADVKSDIQTTSDAVQKMPAMSQVIFMAGDARVSSDKVQAWVKTNCLFDPTTI